MNNFFKNFDWTQAILVILGVGLVVWGVVWITTSENEKDHPRRSIPAISGIVSAGAGIARNGAKKTISKNHDEIVKAIKTNGDNITKLALRVKKLEEKGEKQNDKY